MRQQTLDFLRRLKSTSFPDYVAKVVVFGSEVNNTTRITSDIDLGVVSNFPLSQAQRIEIDAIVLEASPPFDYDLVFVVAGEYRPNFDVRRDIFEKGCVIYERDEHLSGDSRKGLRSG